MTEKPNILVIVSEAGESIPALDALGSAGLRADEFYPSGAPAGANWGSLLTGMHPVRLGMVSEGEGMELPLDASVIAESFLSAGYTTCTFDHLRRRWHWFGTGFEYYIDPGVRLGNAPAAAEINARAIPWLRAHRDEPLFVCVRYGGESGPAIAQLVSALDDLRLSQATLVAALRTSGLGKGELILRWPGEIPAGTKFAGRIQTHDLAPALLEAAGLNAPASMDGRSFWKAWLAGAAWRESEPLYGVDCGPPQTWSMIAGQSALLATIGADGNLRQKSAAGVDPQMAGSMLAQLKAWRKERLEEWARMAESLEEV